MGDRHKGRAHQSGLISFFPALRRVVSRPPSGPRVNAPTSVLTSDHRCRGQRLINRHPRSLRWRTIGDEETPEALSTMITAHPNSRNSRTLDESVAEKVKFGLRDGLRHRSARPDDPRYERIRALLYRSAS